jgi:hypothetical protein
VAQETPNGSDVTHESKSTVLIRFSINSHNTIRDLVSLLMALLWWRLPAGSTPSNPPNCELELPGALAETVHCVS